MFDVEEKKRQRLSVLIQSNNETKTILATFYCKMSHEMGESPHWTTQLTLSNKMIYKQYVGQ